MLENEEILEINDMNRKTDEKTTIMVKIEKEGDGDDVLAWELVGLFV